MGYRHIDNLYKNATILVFKEVYALEKIHGTSAHVFYDKSKSPELTFFSGGEKHAMFVALFDQAALLAAFEALQLDRVEVYGEAYGGKCQGMSAVYGKALKFVVFEVRIGESWVGVPYAAELAGKLGLEFVYYEKVPTTMDALNAQRDAPSMQAVRNGIVEPQMREGIVLRPPVEFKLTDGGAMRAKHKRPEFAETRSKRESRNNPEETLALQTDADEIAKEWVTPMRLAHVVDALKASGVSVADMRATRQVIDAMLADVLREGHGEFTVTDTAIKTIQHATVKLFKKSLEPVV